MAIHGEEIITNLYIAGNRDRTQCNHFRDPQPPSRLILTSIKTKTDTPGRWLHSSRRRTGAEMRCVEFTNHELQDAAHLIRRARSGDERFVFGAHRFPVCAVKVRVVKEVAKVGPALPEHLHLLARKIHVHFSSDGKLSSTALEIHHADTAIVDKKDLLAVR